MLGEFWWGIPYGFPMAHWGSGKPLKPSKRSQDGPGRRGSERPGAALRQPKMASGKGRGAGGEGARYILLGKL